MSGLLTEIKETLYLQRAVETLEKEKKRSLAPRVSALGNNKALTRTYFSRQRRVTSAEGKKGKETAR